jgi:hypothetical protein
MIGANASITSSAIAMSETHSRQPRSAPFSVGLNQEIWDFADLALKARLVKALEDGAAQYPVHRSLRFAARTDLEALFDKLALTLGWRAQRLESGVMVLDADGLPSLPI